MDHELFLDLLPDSSKHLLDLHTSANIGCDERVRDILENSDNKQKVNKRNTKGWTPLMYAACSDDVEIASLLLEEGAEISVKNNSGFTALMLASMYGNAHMVYLLINIGAEINEMDNNGWTALFYAVKLGHRSVVQLLIENGATVNTTDQIDKLTPLMVASAAGHEMIVKDLLTNGVNVGAETKNGDTARSLAIKNGHIKIKDLIDAHNSKHCCAQNAKVTDLQTVLKNLQLSKYFYLFEKNKIDLYAFWQLTEEDLKEMGLELIGPRKKICRVISEWHQNQAQNNDSAESKVIVENRQLQKEVMKLRTILSQEKELKTTAEHNLSKGIQTFKNFSYTMQRTLSYAVLLQEKLMENHSNLKTLLYSNPHNFGLGYNWSKTKTDSIFHLLEGIDKLMSDIHHQTTIALKQADFRT